MALRTGEEYAESIKSLNLEARVMGRKTGDLPEHPLVEPSLRAVAATYDRAQSDDEEMRRLLPTCLHRSAVRKSTASRICTRARRTW